MKYTESYWKDIEQVLSSIPHWETLCHKTVLVTGATGMIGSSVVDILLYLNQHKQAGINIVLPARSLERVKQRFAGFREGTDFTYMAYDATSDQPVHLDGPLDYIIHGASNANPALYTSQPVETMMSNITGLKVLLDLAKEKASRLLYISSSEVYGKKEGTDPYHEQDYGFVDILNFRACYPNAKRVAETLCVSYAEEYGVESVMVRPGHIYGPSITKGDTRASAEFSRNAAAGRNIVMKSPGNQLRSYCYTLDCASAILCVLINGNKEEAYNISNPDSICTIRQIAQALAQAGHVALEMAVPTELEKKGYNLMSNSSLDSQKLEALGWKGHFSLEEGCQKTIEGLS